VSLLSPTTGAGVDLDPEEAERSKLGRARQLNVVEIPRLRLIGFTLLAIAVPLHNRFVLGAFDWRDVVVFAVLVETYAVVSWLVLARWYGRTRRVDLGTVFLALDLVGFTLAVYYSGGDRSWLFFILTMRVADQTGTSFRRALAFGHAAVAAYLGMLLWLHYGEHRALVWPAEWTKVVSIYGATLYIALTARTAERRRRRTAEAIHVARSLIRALAEQSAELDRARVAAEEGSRAKSQFLASMSHELRTPLNSIVGFSKVLLNRIDGDLSERQETYLRAVHTSGTHLLRLINGILDLSRIEAGRLDLTREDLDLADVIAECMDETGSLARGKPVKLERDVPSELPRVFADRTKVKQVLLNLLSNAIKFTAAGRILVRVQPEPDALRVSVADTGIGIRADALPQLFEPFHRIPGRASLVAGGTGLGLAISRRFVEMHGGRIWVESREHQGSTFHFTLPLKGRS
jgi:signal transduction histidine kinase